MPSAVYEYMVDLVMSLPIRRGLNSNNNNNTNKLKENSGSYSRKTFDRFTTADSYTWNIAHNTESTAVCKLSPGRWGSPVVQKKFQEEKLVTRDIIIIDIIIVIIIIIIIVSCHRLTLWEFTWISDNPHPSGVKFHTALLLLLLLF
jgi:hypothetical protein